MRGCPVGQRRLLRRKAAIVRSADDVLRDRIRCPLMQTEFWMNFAPDLATVTHGIQLAVAPVFLLTAVSGMIAAVAGRLARIIDRARFLENRLEAGGVEETRANKMYAELGELRHRGWLVNGCLALLTFCAILIGLTIVFMIVTGLISVIAGRGAADLVSSFLQILVLLPLQALMTFAAWRSVFGGQAPAARIDDAHHDQFHA